MPISSNRGSPSLTIVPHQAYELEVEQSHRAPSHQRRDVSTMAKVSRLFQFMPPPTQPIDSIHNSKDFSQRTKRLKATRSKLFMDLAIKKSEGQGKTEAIHDLEQDISDLERMIRDIETLTQTSLAPSEKRPTSIANDTISHLFEF